MTAESSLLYPKSESRNSGFRSHEETQRTIDFLLAELTRQQDRFDATRLDLEDTREEMAAMKADNRDLEHRFELLVKEVLALKAENARLREAR